MLFDLYMGPKQVLPLQISVDQGVMVTKKFAILPRAWEVESYHLGYSLGGRVLQHCIDADGIFYSLVHFAFHIALIPLGKVWTQLFSLHLWVKSRAEWTL